MVCIQPAGTAGVVEEHRVGEPGNKGPRLFRVPAPEPRTHCGAVHDGWKSYSGKSFSEEELAEFESAYRSTAADYWGLLF